MRVQPIRMAFGDDTLARFRKMYCKISVLFFGLQREAEYSWL